MERRNVVEQGKKPKISFENYIVTEIILKPLDENDKENKNKFGISIGIDEKLEYVKLRIKNSTEKRYLEVEMIGKFKFEEGMLEQEKEKFLKINGASILYPYIRAYISTITSFDKEGSAVILPTINFESFYEDEKKTRTKKPKSQEPK